LKSLVYWLYESSAESMEDLRTIEKFIHEKRIWDAVTDQRAPNNEGLPQQIDGRPHIEGFAKSLNIAEWFEIMQYIKQPIFS